MSYQAAALLAENAALTERNETQQATIKALWVKNAALEKRNDHGQAHIAKIEDRNKRLAAQLTNEAMADRFFTN